MQKVLLSEFYKILGISRKDWKFSKFSKIMGSSDDEIRQILCDIGGETAFEFGTFLGDTANALSLAFQKVYTFDVGQPSDSDYPYPIPIEEIGSSARDNPKVVQLRGNSETYDFSPYYGMCDLVFVDGNHSYAGCKSDILSAVKLLKPGGVVVGHDFYSFSEWVGVNQSVAELDPEMNFFDLGAFATGETADDPNKNWYYSFAWQKPKDAK